MSYQTDRDEFIARMVHEFRAHAPHIALGVAQRIMREARTLQKHAETMCNGEPTKFQAARAAGAERRLVAAVAELPGLHIAEMTGDPRGYVVKLRLPSGKGNTWGGDACGWGVPA